MKFKTYKDTHNDIPKHLEYIWSKEFWEEVAEEIEMRYWNVIKGKIPHAQPPDVDRNTEHRIEAFIRRMSRKKGEGNLHIGMTSSDLEDNIRILRIYISYHFVSSALNSFYDMLLQYVSERRNKKIIAYTHLLPAGITNIERRMLPTIDSHAHNPVPHIYFKGIKGAIGDRKIQSLMGVSQTELDNIIVSILNDVSIPCHPTTIPTDIQRYSHQTGDHQTEHEVSSWMCREASLLAKISNDFRQMFSLGQAYHIHKDIGSTAIPNKKPNPWRYERVSGMAETIYDLPSKMARISANCLLERTLTNQSILNHIFHDSFLIFSKMIEDISKAISCTEIIPQDTECKKAKYHAEERMLQ